MKKQILLLTFFVVTILAGMNVNAQPPGIVDTNPDSPYLDAAPASCPIPTPLGCYASSDTPLNPTPGKTYEYSITVDAGSNVHWFATTELTVLTAEGTVTASREASGGTYVLSAGTKTGNGDADYDDIANTGTTLEVAWNYFPSTQNMLLVAYAVDATGCTDNIEVWKIEPVHNFILDIQPLADNGTVGTGSECVSPVQTAIYDGAGQLDVDYGTNYIYYIVSAANWVNSWQPTFTAPTSAGGSSVTIDWAYADATDWSIATWNASTDPVLASGYTGSPTSIDANGACIVVRLTVDHDANEFLADETLTLGIDGRMWDGTGYADASLDDVDDDGTNCVQNITDSADYTITSRPNIDNETPAEENKVGS
jgi:hypothetical protein